MPTCQHPIVDNIQSPDICQRLTQTLQLTITLNTLIIPTLTFRAQNVNIPTPLLNPNPPTPQAHDLPLPLPKYRAEQRPVNNQVNNAIPQPLQRQHDSSCNFEHKARRIRVVEGVDTVDGCRNPSYEVGGEEEKGNAGVGCGAAV